MEGVDAVIIGGRCAGATLALSLARRGWEVMVVDQDTFPSETISTHLIFPNTLARLEELGVLDALGAAHRVPLLEFVIVGRGHRIASSFTPVGGFDRCAAPRRVALDQALLDTALAAGARCGPGRRVVDLIGSGTLEDPVAGVILDDGERISARWTFGADGRASTLARRLGLAKTRELRGEVGFLFAYWKGIPDDGYATSDIREHAIVNRWSAEDGVSLLIAWGDAAFTRGSKDERMRRYLERLREFPELVEPRVLDRAELVSDLVVAPESLMRGFFRTPAGPGWALVGDACHFKHPSTAQGIADAVEQAVYIADALSGANPTLDGYEAWRDERAAEHYDWSFAWGRIPGAETEPLFRGWAAEPDAAHDLLATFSRGLAPSRALSRERLARWLSP